MENSFKEEIQKIKDMVDGERTICTTTPEAAERLVLAFAKARVPFTYIPEGYFENVGETATIKIHAKPESFMPIYNFATSMKLEEPIEQEMVKELLKKYNVNLVICPKENNDKWDIL